MRTWYISTPAGIVKIRGPFAQAVTLARALHGEVVVV